MRRISNWVAASPDHIGAAIAFLIFLAGCLGGCAPVQPACPPIEKPIEVKIPVPVPCDPPVVAAPDLPVDHVKASASFPVKTRAVLDSLDMEIEYSTEISAELNACR